MAWALNINLFIRGSYEKALSDAQKMLRYGRDLLSRVDRYDILGSPKDVIGRVEKYADAGVQHLILHVNSGQGGLDHDFEVLAKEIAPHFR